MLEGNRLAIVIGINQYSDPNIIGLKGAQNDAEEICDILRNKEIGNFSVRKLVGETATSYEIRRAISDVFWDNQSFYDLVLFYFSGHGFVDQYKDGYIAPYDMSKHQPFVNGIKMSELTEIISKTTKKASVIMILDCCFSGILAKGDEQIEISLDRAGKGRLAFASSEADAVSREDLYYKHNEQDKPHPHGIFTSRLIDGLYGKAADKDGIINMDELRKYVEGSISEAGRQMPLFKVSEGSQTHEIKIAIASGTYHHAIQDLINKLEAICKNPDIQSLMEAPNLVVQLNNLDKNNEEVANFKEQIDNHLIKYKTLVVTWLIKNQKNLRPLVNKIRPSLFQQLRELADYLSFKMITGVNNDSSEYDLLVILCDFADKPSPPNRDFTGFLVNLRVTLGIESPEPTVSSEPSKTSVITGGTGKAPAVTSESSKLSARVRRSKGPARGR
jgi:hypothetical protein